MNKDERGKKLLEVGADISGGVAGSAVGLVFGGPGGAVAGAFIGSAVGPVVKAAVLDAAQRMMSKSEQVRVGAALGYAADFSAKMEAAGLPPRSDDFFTETPHGRAAATELAEGVIRTAQQEYEERKIPHIGRLLAAIGHQDHIDRITANWLLRMASELSWTQYVLLAIYADEHMRNQLPNVDIGRSGSTQWLAHSIHAELARIGWGQLELVTSRDETDAEKAERTAPRDGLQLDLPAPILFGLRDQRLSGHGPLLHGALNLQSIDRITMLNLIDDLKIHGPTVTLAD